MKDIIITATRIKKELIWLLVSIVISILINIHSIIKFNTAWKELLTQIHVILILALIIYFLVMLIRLLVGLLLRLVPTKKS